MSKNWEDYQPPINELISLLEASKNSGLSSGHINFLIRTNKLWGIKLGRNWFTTQNAMQIYLNSARKPGPKKA